MRRAFFAVALSSLALGAQTLPQTPLQTAASQTDSAPQRKIPCKTPENAGMCYWTRGRLAFYNGNPPYRVWKIGTKRVLGIFSGPAIWPPQDQQDQLDPELPANVRALFKPPANRIFADFEVCPLEAERPGWMQAACVESATHIYVASLH
jgi:hypothetical protein